MRERLDELDYHVFIHLERNLSLIQNYGAKIVEIIYLCKLSSPLSYFFEVVRPYLGTFY